MILLVPGRAADADAWRSRLGKQDLKWADETLTGLPFEARAEFIENDGGFGEAFGYGTVDREGVAAIAACPGALLLTLEARLDEHHEALAQLGKDLKKCGALAVRFEDSKLGWAIDDFIARVGEGHPATLYRLAVVTLRSPKELASCGIHLFARPDVRVVVAGKGSGAAAEAQRVLEAFNLYLLAEDPELAPGHSFAPDADTERRRLARWPDDQYPSSHPCHNPFGAWHLGPPGESSRKVPAQAMVFMPPLVTLLTAAEEKKGKALTKKEVEALRDKSAVLAMSWRDAARHERSRGYADLDPELAWEQWQRFKASR
ncbi:MAG: hypothetical protein U0228_24465 [Myxococcaceae bacterium]